MRRFWFLIAACSLPALAGTRENLTSLKLPDASITRAIRVEAGAFTIPAGRGPAPNFKDLPAFCRVFVTLTPSSDSDIKVEVWLALHDWNEKFEGTANGACAGTIGYAALADALRRRYAANFTCKAP